MPDLKRLDIAVVGAGLGGAFAALLLGREGHRVTVFDKRPDPRHTPPAEGRSINLGISQRALDVLAGAGLPESLGGIATPMVGRLIHGRGGGLDFQPYGGRDESAASLILTPGEPVHAVRRAELARALIDAADQLPNVVFRFGARLEALTPQTGELELGYGPGAERERVLSELVVCADGAFSTARRAFEHAVGFSESLEELEIGYKQLTIRRPANGAKPLRHDVHHLWPREGFVMTGLPNPDRSFTATLFASRDTLESLATEGKVRDFFSAQFEDVTPLMPELEKEYLERPASRLVTLGCSPWSCGRAVLIGDACHAFMPFSGQGANAALIDAAALTACLAEHGPDMGSALRAFERRRKPETDAIAHLSRVMMPLILWLAEPLMAPAVDP